jgi:hypothetical protein
MLTFLVEVQCQTVEMPPKAPLRETKQSRSVPIMLKPSQSTSLRKRCLKKSKYIQDLILFRGGKISHTNAENIDALMEKSRAHLAVPVDTAKSQGKPMLIDADKTQGSSTPVSPADKLIVLPPPMPKIKVNLNYQQINEVAKSNFYLKHVPTVHVDHPWFDFATHDFELRVNDRSFLKEVEISE